MDPVQTNETLTTERLTLRPFELSDASTVQALCGNLRVARMLAAVPHPYPDGLAEDWIGSHAARRAKGTHYIFAIVFGGDLVGAVGLEQREDGIFEVGYWIGEPWWGKGLATEAVDRVVAFARDELGRERLVAGHFLDNPASGRVLEKCGFCGTGEKTGVSAARSGEWPMRRMAWRRAAPERTQS